MEQEGELVQMCSERKGKGDAGTFILDYCSGSFLQKVLQQSMRHEGQLLAKKDKQEGWNSGGAEETVV